ncbi:11999_t:CDS:2, partial [Ambispora gerdemannii]
MAPFLPKLQTIKIQVVNTLWADSQDFNIVGLSDSLWSKLSRHILTPQSEANVINGFKSVISISITPRDVSQTSSNLLKPKPENTWMKPLITSIVTFAQLHHSEIFGEAPDYHTCFVSRLFAKQHNLVDGIEVDIDITQPIELEE